MTGGYVVVRAADWWNASVPGYCGNVDSSADGNDTTRNIPASYSLQPAKSSSGNFETGSGPICSAIIVLTPRMMGGILPNYRMLRHS